MIVASHHGRVEFDVRAGNLTTSIFRCDRHYARELAEETLVICDLLDRRAAEAEGDEEETAPEHDEPEGA